jgi:hypothetical protein
MDTNNVLEQIIKYEDELNDIIDKCDKVTDKLYDEECIDEIRENIFNSEFYMLLKSFNIENNLVSITIIRKILEKCESNLIKINEAKKELVILEQYYEKSKELN